MKLHQRVMAFRCYPGKIVGFTGMQLVETGALMVYLVELDKPLYDPKKDLTVSIVVIPEGQLTPIP